MDLAQTVLAAFQVEHRTQLEGVRALLADVGRGGVQSAGRLDEAYRLVHSLKGGARACGLDHVETMGHRLETLFARIRAGALALDGPVAAAIGRVLDAIEDVMAAVETGAPPPDVGAALAGIARLTGDEGARPGGGVPAPPPASPELVAAFGRECRQHLERVRRLTAGLGSEADLAEAEAALRDLRHAAGLVGAPRILGEIAERLELLLGRVRDGAAPSRERLTALVESGSASIERLADGEVSADAAEVLREMESALGTPESAGPGPAAVTPEPAAASDDTVWLRAASLEHLLASAERLEAECSGRVAGIGDEIAVLHAGLHELHRGWASVREHAAGALGTLHATPEYARVARFLDLADRRLHLLLRRGREIDRLYQRHAWSLRSLGAQLHRDVRGARMVSAQSVFGGLRKSARDLLRDCGKQAEVEVTGLAVEADRLVLQALKDPLLHLLRNAVAHGIETPEERRAAGKPERGRIAVALEARSDQLTIRVADDGRGLDQARLTEAARQAGVTALPSEAARVALEAGVSTMGHADRLSGRGMGLAIVREAVERLQGRIELATAGVGFAVTVVVPVSVASQRLLLVAQDGVVYGIPVYAVGRLLRVRPEALDTVEGAPVVLADGEAVSLVALSALLGAPDGTLCARGGYLCAVVVETGGRRLAVAVDAFVGPREALIHGLPGAVVAPAMVAGAITGDDGAVGLVLNPHELVTAVVRPGPMPALQATDEAHERRVPTILVVDDSFTTRTLEKSMLEAHGYDVRVAVDGAEAWTLLQSEPVDLVVSDIQMPVLDGFGLLERIRQDARLRDLPVIMVTSMHAAGDRERGLTLGANAYVTKQRFDHEELLGIIGQLV